MDPGSESQASESKIKDWIHMHKNMRRDLRQLDLSEKPLYSHIWGAEEPTVPFYEHYKNIERYTNPPSNGISPSQILGIIVGILVVIMIIAAVRFSDSLGDF